MRRRSRFVVMTEDGWLCSRSTASRLKARWLALWYGFRAYARLRPSRIVIVQHDWKSSRPREGG